jgi:beta-aspartyl-peptidase (threonine type)
MYINKKGKKKKKMKKLQKIYLRYLDELKEYGISKDVIQKLKNVTKSDKFFKPFVKKIKKNTIEKSNTKEKYGIVIHGGAGKTKDSEKEKILQKFVEIGFVKLKNGERSIDVVHDIIKNLEETGSFNAGSGSVKNKQGKQQMDACLMDGSTLHSGTVIAIKNVKHPISIAKKILNTPNLFALAGEDAIQFDTSNFINKKIHKKSCGIDNVGCVCLDKKGHLAAGTSTGGISQKHPGRVGDVGMVGAGTYADDVCAISCSGIGEYFIQHLVAKSISSLIKLKGFSLKKACEEIINKLPNNTGGVIAIDLECNIEIVKNTNYLLNSHKKNLIKGEFF